MTSLAVMKFKIGKSMTEQFTFSELDPVRLHEALSLVRDVFLEFQAPGYFKEGVQEFMRFTEPETICAMLSENKMRIWTCICTGRIVGVLAARNDHIHLLFVDKRFHRNGIARQLFNRMVENFNTSEVTVYSSPYAVEAYRKLGFADTDKEQIVNGMRMIPMKFNRPQFDL